MKKIFLCTFLIISNFMQASLNIPQPRSQQTSAVTYAGGGAASVQPTQTPINYVCRAQTPINYCICPDCMEHKTNLLEDFGDLCKPLPMCPTRCLVNIYLFNKLIKIADRAGGQTAQRDKTILNTQYNYSKTNVYHSILEQIPGLQELLVTHHVMLDTEKGNLPEILKFQFENSYWKTFYRHTDNQ